MSSAPGTQKDDGQALVHGANLLIQGGSFIQHNRTGSSGHVCADADDGFKHLQAHVATSAFDSDEKVDAPKCHPNTRLAVLDQIMTWVILTAMRVEWIVWLNGAAGAGKSAIARSIVERCMKLNIPLARFFFFRTDHTRNTTKSLVATLAHQLIECLPELRITIVTRIQRNPLIFTLSLETQLNQLIFEPLRLLHECSTSERTVLLVFDGVDELSGNDNQADLIRIVSNFVASNSTPLIVLFSSRAENQLKQAFSSRKMSDFLLQIPLDNNYMADDDIRLFLKDSFAEVNETHPYRLLLPPDWPEPALVEETVDKSSGQFIYASVVVKFVSTPNMHPAQQLDIVRGLRPVGTLTPFAQLDALYRHIFSQVDDPQRVMYVLAAVIFSNTSNLGNLERMFPNHMFVDSAPILLAGLASVVTCASNEIRFLHASLPDFLLDYGRSQEFYLDRTAWSTCLARDITMNIGMLSVWIEEYINFLEHAQPTEELKKRLFHVLPDVQPPKLHRFIHYLSVIQNIDFSDGNEVYRLHLRHVTRTFVNKFPGYLPALQERHDTSLVMDEINGVSECRTGTRSRSLSVGEWIMGKSKAWLKNLRR